MFSRINQLLHNLLSLEFPAEQLAVRSLRRAPRHRLRLPSSASKQIQRMPQRRETENPRITLVLRKILDREVAHRACLTHHISFEVYAAIENNQKKIYATERLFSESPLKDIIPVNLDFRLEQRVLASRGKAINYIEALQNLVNFLYPIQEVFYNVVTSKFGRKFLCCFYHCFCPFSVLNMFS